MTCVVLTRFADLQDGKHVYEAGDTYPRPGLEVSPERIAELAGSDNRTGSPLIVDIDAPCKTCSVDTGEAHSGAANDEPVEHGDASEKPAKGRCKSRKAGNKGGGEN